MMIRGFHLTGGVMVAALLCCQATPAEEIPLTGNVPISEFQNRTEDIKAYDFDAPPRGMFRSIAMAEDFEERLGPLRTHEIVPIKPTERFREDVAAIFIVFSLHQHYQAFTVFGRCIPEQVAGGLPGTIVSEDAGSTQLVEGALRSALGPQAETCAKPVAADAAAGQAAAPTLLDSFAKPKEGGVKIQFLD